MEAAVSDERLRGRRLRLIHAVACPFPSPQGSQVYVRGMARALGRRGHDVTVACYGHGVDMGDTEYRLARIPRLPGYGRMSAGPDMVKPLLDLALAVRLSGLSADVVHAHNYEAPVAAALSRIWTGIPMVYSAHNTMKEELPSYFRGRPMRALATALGTGLDACIPRMADHGIAINPSVVETLRGLGCARVTHIPPGIDAEDLIEVEPLVLGGGLWVVYAGTTDSYQDLDILVSAMKAINATPALNVSLLVVSASPMNGWSRGDVAGVRCVQTDDFSVVRRLLAGADVAVLPRSVCSGYPMKLLNYLGMGLPTVAAAGSARDMPGVVTVPNNDPDAVANALIDLLMDPQRRRRLGGAARRHVLAHCSWDARAVAVEAVYKSVLTNRESQTGVCVA